MIKQIFVCLSTRQSISRTNQSASDMPNVHPCSEKRNCEGPQKSARKKIESHNPIYRHKEHKLVKIEQSK